MFAQTGSLVVTWVRGWGFDSDGSWPLKDGIATKIFFFFLKELASL